MSWRIHYAIVGLICLVVGAIALVGGDIGIGLFILVLGVGGSLSVLLNLDPPIDRGRWFWRPIRSVRYRVADD